MEPDEGLNSYHEIGFIIFRKSVLCVIFVKAWFMFAVIFLVIIVFGEYFLKDLRWNKMNIVK